MSIKESNQNVVKQVADEAVLSHFVLGGARSGKSAFAEQQTQAWLKAHPDGCVYYVATSPTRYQSDDTCAPQEDREMLQRIQHHQQRRPSEWLTLEEPIYLADQLQQLQVQMLQANRSQRRCVVLLDCLTLWMLNIIEADCREREVAKFLAFLNQSQIPLIMVSNEVGLGVVPLGKLSREFVDELGRLHQEVAKRVERVTFVTAGLPMQLKG